MILLPVLAKGQTTEPDSLTVNELGEITVVADAQYTSATKTVYIPSKKEKSTASDGVSLLSRMNIPQLSVNPIKATVMTADNQGVSLYINFHPATDEDVSGLNPEDIKRVEYLDFPTDPRFQRAQHVVNFITQSYIYGGYTKLNAKERFLVRNGEASASFKSIANGFPSTVFCKRRRTLSICACASFTPFSKSNPIEKIKLSAVAYSDIFSKFVHQ